METVPPRLQLHTRIPRHMPTATRHTPPHTEP